MDKHAAKNNSHNGIISPILPSMIGMTEHEAGVLERLGEGPRSQRKRRGDSQLDAAARRGVSRETFRQMERGNPGTGVGCWVRAIRLYGDLVQLEALFSGSLFLPVAGG
ncbi:MAG: hypothetical protein C0630_16345 [Sedimenticola selenatireducens]|uniref:XRE family transcriptional regulator n=2 Tax=Sedimenticola selenatireducens TaxID=191960 RepID=A0A2N6CTB6_9GAMM|nr:MAG: hypothetical protein C0630_16345 [Sedimenticola selenatireducens]